MAWSRFFRRRYWDDERARELEAHLAIEADEHVARGMSVADARDAARRKLGNLTRVREEIYDMNTLGFLDTLWQDLRYGARLLRLNPSFACVAILSLALGIGANTAIFELLNALRLRTLPVAHPEQLVEVRILGGDDRSGGFNGNHPTLTNGLWERIRDRQQAFSGAFAWGTHDFELSSGGESRRAQGLWVSGGFFQTLGVRPSIGRLLTPEDDHRGCGAPPAVISYAFWQREFGGSPSALGGTLRLDGHAYDIAGVSPPGFFGVEVGQAYDVAVPLCAEVLSGNARSWLDQKNGWFLGAMGRLKPDWTVERATAHLTALSAPIFRETLPTYRPEDERAYLGFKLGAIPSGTGVSNLRRQYETPLWLLLAMTALVLAIACANLANLLLARATAREREIAVRLALGASRIRIVRQLLAESLLLASAAALAGGVLAQSLSRVLVASMTTESDPVFVDTTGDVRVFLFVALLAALACVIVGLMPAIRATATSPGAAMKAGSRGSTDSRERFGLRRVLVVAQVALSLVLVVGALLFAISFRNLITTDAGFTRQQILVASFDFRGARLSEPALQAGYGELLERVRHAGGVEEVAQVRNVPLGGSFSNRNIIIDGVKRKGDVNYNAVSDRYFATMATALVAGRDFDRRDTATAPHVAIVSESFARKFFDGQNPIGRRFQIDDAPDTPRPEIEIVGLAHDSKYSELREPFEPLIYVPVAQDASIARSRLVVRSNQLASASAAVAALARELHPSIIVRFRNLQTVVDESVVRERLMATLSLMFGGLAALIAAIGLYGVMSYTVAQRRNEIGIRMALGADRGQVVSMVMGEAGRLLAAGLALGTIAALAAARSARALLFGLTPHDPVVLATAAASLAAVAALASYLPARRASRLEPTEALREE